MVSRRNICLALCAFPTLARADLYDDYINSTSKQPFVSFQGRKATLDTIGHAFVGVGVQIDSGLRVYERFFGLYPKDGVLAAIKSVFTPATGLLDQTWNDLAWDTQLIQSIDDSQKALVLAKFDEWTSSTPQYSLTANNSLNCNALVAAVAQSVGLKVPSGAGSTRPWKFIEALKALN
jgi:hypothetical protein